MDHVKHMAKDFIKLGAELNVVEHLHKLMLIMHIMLVEKFM
jgi:ribosome biogenesis SPOUT family RNA methylase Rps3